jgi:Diacylglycerol acyltransferase
MEALLSPLVSRLKDWRWCGTLIIVPYVATVLFDSRPKKGGAVWPWLQHLSLWKRVGRYLNGSIETEVPLDPNQLYIFCCFPHGAATVNHLLIMTDACGMLSKVYPSPRRDLAASVLFYIPFVRSVRAYINYDTNKAYPDL